MQSEERRKIIEEVSGISVYEMRKEKSINELEKTEEKLKEVLAILRERTIYLNNLEKENQELRDHNKELSKMNDELLEERYECLKNIRTNKKQ